MKKRFVTILALMLAVVFVLGFAGCGKKTDGTAKDQMTTKAASDASVDEDADEAQQQGEEVVAENTSRIGEYVHYNVNIGVGNAKSVDDDWIVFYQDEDKGITYLIAASLLSTDTCPALVTAFERGGLKHTVTFSDTLNVSYSVTFNNYDPYNEAVIDSALRERYMHTWEKKLQGDTHKHSYIADLMDQNVWDEFVLKDKDGKKFDDSMMIAAGPSIDLFEKSWEASGYTPIKYEIGAAAKVNRDYDYEGYIFPESSATYKNYIELDTLEKSGYGEDENYNKIIDLVYFSGADDAPDCYGYWLISPGAEPDNSNNLLAVFNYNYGKIDSFCFDNNNCSVRPVVSFNTSLIGNDSSSEIYYLGKNIND